MQDARWSHSSRLGRSGQKSAWLGASEWTAGIRQTFNFFFMFCETSRGRSGRGTSAAVLEVARHRTTDKLHTCQPHPPPSPSFLGPYKQSRAARVSTHFLHMPKPRRCSDKQPQSVAVSNRESMRWSFYLLHVFFFVRRLSLTDRSPQFVSRSKNLFVVVSVTNTLLSWLVLLQLLEKDRWLEIRYSNRQDTRYNNRKIAAAMTKRQE